MDFFVEPSLEWTPLAEEDLAQLEELREAIEYIDDPVERLGRDDLLSYWTAPAGQPGENAVVGRDSAGTIVAYGWNLPRGDDAEAPRVWLDGGVHPAWRHKQIGRRLLRWQVARALEWYQELQLDLPVTGPLTICRYVDEKLAGATRAVEHEGFAPSCWYFDMHRPLFDEQGHRLPLPSAPLDPAVTLAPYHPDLSERVRMAHNRCYRVVQGSHRVSRAMWEHWTSQPGSRPQWSWVAWAGDELVGYAMNSAYEQDWSSQGQSEGWTDRVGVLPEWQGRGIMPTLLVASMRSFGDAGLHGAGLGVATPDPDRVLELVESVGYGTDEMLVLYERRFAPDGTPLPVPGPAAHGPAATD